MNARRITPRFWTPRSDKAERPTGSCVSGQLPVIIAVVVTVAFLLIMTAFRSLPLAIKAAALNPFSIRAGQA